MHKGIAVSPGVVVGVAFRVDTVFGSGEPQPLASPGMVPAEVERFERAVAASSAELEAIVVKVAQQLGSSEAEIFRLIAARVTAALVVLCAPVVDGSPSEAVRAWRRDAARHPSPNAGVVEAAFAGALGVQLGGPTHYHHELQIRPTLGEGRAPAAADLRRAVTLSRVVSAAAAVLVTGATLASAVSGYRRRP